MTGDPAGTVIRTRRHLTTVGVDPDDEEAPPPVCTLCGETRLFALHARQGHHVAGRVNDPDLTAPVCLNCHADQTEQHRRAGVRLRDDPDLPPTGLDRLMAMLAGAGVFLRELGDRLVGWADFLRRLVAVLDRALPGWREAAAGVPGPPGITVPGVPALPAGDQRVGEDRGPHDH